MKKYKLLKDLPTFKAGELFETDEDGSLWKIEREPDCGYKDSRVMAYHGETIKKFPNILTDWFEEIKEPLIKDEKIRKTVKAWAEANDITEINVSSNGYELWGGIDEWCIHFGGNPFKNIKPLKYTIDELCGEDEK
jgi:hypothetical protein